MPRSERRLVLFLLAFALLLFRTSVCAENSLRIYDYSFDFEAYRETVAVLNRNGSTLADNSQRRQILSETGLFAVLVRTNGEEIDASPYAPSYVVAGPENCYTLFFPGEELANAAVEQLSRLPGVRYAEHDAAVSACETIPDQTPEYPAFTFHSYGAARMHFSDYLLYAGTWGSGEALVAVIDSGVSRHSLINSKLLSGGYDYIDADTDATSDLYGHGTNVAGVIADCTAPAPVYIYPIRVLNSEGKGKISNVVNAVREATARGVDVINLSIESSVMSQPLDEAILDALGAGITVVVAAGNGSQNTSQVCPAHLTNQGVIVIGSAEGNDEAYQRASYSNYGSSVDVYAFGSGISCCSIGGGYSNETGTSLAAPHISALSALLHLIHPGLSPAGTETRIKASATGQTQVKVPDLRGMMPSSTGFFLEELVLESGDEVQLPVLSLPYTALENIRYVSSDETVVSVENGRLSACGVGTALVQAICTGFEDTGFQVVVCQAARGTLSLPAGIRTIEEEAFSGNDSIERAILPPGTQSVGKRAFADCPMLKTIRVPDSVTDIGEEAFSQAVILCSQNSVPFYYALENGLYYISTE